MQLAPLTVLKQRYTVKETLEEPGPFDITYRGQDVNSDEEFVIREFFPTHLVDRDEGATSVSMKGEEEADHFESGREYFRKESEVLAGLTHEALPSSYDSFEANGTYYRVRTRPSGMSLARGLEAMGTLTERAALTAIVPILEALHEAHDNGLYHGGVSPRTIQLLEGGEVLLTGFRGAFFQVARESGTLTDLVQPGTSAVEQYTPRGKQGPWTDVYAAAATLCQMVTGEPVPDSTNRLEGDDPLEERIQDADVFSAPGVRQALVDALAVDPSKRLQSVEALLEALVDSSVQYDEDDASYAILPGEPEPEEAPAEEDPVEVLSTETTATQEEQVVPSSTGETTQRGGMGRTALLVGLPVLALTLGGGAWFFVSSGTTSNASTGSYQEYRSRADSLFESGNYETAEFLYNQALEVKDDDKYVQQRLEKLERMQRESGARSQRLLRRGDALRATADSLFTAGAMSEAANTYSKALGAYYSAQNASPDDATVQQRIQDVQRRQKQIARRRAGGGGERESESLSIEQLATFFREQGDRQLEAGNLQAALDKYQQALEYTPDDEQLQTVIADLEEQIDEQRRRRTFRARYNEGQELLRADRYEAAKAAFQEAAEIYPDNPDLKEALSETNALLEKRRRARRYEQYRAQGDSLFRTGNLQAAISSYRRALDARSDDGYAKRRIESARAKLEQQRRAQKAEAQQQQNEQRLTDEDGVYKTVDQVPEVKGGLAALSRTARYPEEARDKGLEGRVYVEAIIGPDGRVRDATVTRGVSDALDQEALRAVRDAEFVPGRYNGTPVPARTTVWIQFRLED